MDPLAILSRLGLGTAQFGNLYVESSDAEAEAAVEAAWEAGIRSFDTAPHYGLGLAERRLGRALRGLERDAYVISTKVGRVLEPNPDFAPGAQDDQGFVVPASTRRRWDFSRDGILRSLDDSLTRLGLDRVDIVYLHDPDDHWEIASTEGIETLLDLRAQGVVGAVGAGMNQAAMLTRFVESFDVDVVLVAGRLTLLDQSALAELVPAARRRGARIAAAGVYNSGILSSATVADDSHYDYAKAADGVVERAREIARVAERHGTTLPAAAVQYPLGFDAVASVVVGAGTARHVHDAVERARAQIPDAFWQELDELALVPSSTRHHQALPGASS
ncbi:aldo/keto reductase [Frondihabitans australicus]|uniref:D-threo-aldose 1-dehydrogenase n=1 Tax=Frondihabitans australicus TaxID=386892 RepID=A0A495IGA9_9MICO|nr:aldo/keto reductase [Frondihabitans australicus]RKR75052.1 D-threo-aldose 1-dehydrogenase [Frondihabitans australicus]